MAMTFLQMFVRAHAESGISGAAPTATASQTGKLLKLRNWVEQAWVDIQNERPNWLFMWAQFNGDTVADQRDYDASSDWSVTDLKHWDTGSFLIHKTSLTDSDQNFLEYMPYDRWRESYRNQMAVRATGRPQLFTILPDNKIRFEPVSDVAYTIEGEYSKTSQVLAIDADTPTGLPDDYHMIIVWQALKYYGHYEDAPEVLDKAETFFENLNVKLEDNQLPEFSTDIPGLV